MTCPAYCDSKITVLQHNTSNDSVFVFLTMVLTDRLQLLIADDLHANQFSIYHYFRRTDSAPLCCCYMELVHSRQFISLTFLKSVCASLHGVIFSSESLETHSKIKMEQKTTIIHKAILRQAARQIPPLVPLNSAAQGERRPIMSKGRTRKSRE